MKAKLEDGASTAEKFFCYGKLIMVNKIRKLLLSRCKLSTDASYNPFQISILGGVRLCLIFVALQLSPMTAVHCILNGNPIMVMALSM